MREGIFAVSMQLDLETQLQCLRELGEKLDAGSRPG